MQYIEAKQKPSVLAPRAKFNYSNLTSLVRLLTVMVVNNLNFHAPQA